MFSGTLQAFQASLSTEPFLILTALMAVYIVLGILYESYIHPITILSTLPSAGVGAVLALLLFHIDLSVIALIGIILLIGIVKKNAILMIDFALAAERKEDKTSADAIFQACLLRFRPILMTTMAALFGALPLALGTGTGSELRRPLGITIVGGLIVSQMLTLYTTPVVYLYLDRLRLRWARHTGAPRAIAAGAPTDESRCTLSNKNRRENTTNKIHRLRCRHFALLMPRHFAAALHLAAAPSARSITCPPLQAPAAYKELTPADFSKTDGWKVAQPKTTRCTASGGKYLTIHN